jgi:hypothetical protein
MGTRCDIREEDDTDENGSRQMGIIYDRWEEAVTDGKRMKPLGRGRDRWEKNETDGKRLMERRLESPLIENSVKAEHTKTLCVKYLQRKRINYASSQ